MEKLKYYVASLKRILTNKHYAISRLDLDTNLVGAVDEITKALEGVATSVSVKFAKLHPEAVVPTYAKAGDAGLDLTAVGMKLVKEDGVEFYEYDLGLAVEIPEGFVGLLFPRSSISKTDLSLSNSVGVVDSGYRGRLSARFRKTVPSPHTYKTGERVVQLVVLPFPKATVTEVKYDELSKTVRGAGSFGSSGA